MKRIHIVWCEWDIGQDYVAFDTEGDALHWLKGNGGVLDCCEEGTSIEDLMDEGLIGITSRTLISY